MMDAMRGARYAGDTLHWAVSVVYLLRGRRAVVVERQGAFRDWPGWHAGVVFWQENQRDLLIADHQGRKCAEAKPEWPQVLSGMAWAHRARPS